MPLDHPLRPLRSFCDEALGALDGRFEALYWRLGRASIAAEPLLRATLLQSSFSVRSARMLMEQIDDNLLLRWFVGLPMDAEVWHPIVFTKNRDRLLETEVGREFLTALLDLPRVKRLLSRDHFTLDGTLIDAWASMKSFRPKHGSGGPPAPGRTGERNFRRQKRSNETHASTTDSNARLYRKGDGQSRRLCFMGPVLVENRSGLAVDATLTMLDRRGRRRRVTLGAGRAYDVAGFIGALRGRKVTPHIGVNGAISKTGKRRKTAIDGSTTRHPGHEISQHIRKRVEKVFG